MSSPRPHWPSRRSRSCANPSARRFITVATRASASSTAPRGSSTKRTWISSQRDWKPSASARSGAASSVAEPLDVELPASRGAAAAAAGAAAAAVSSRVSPRSVSVASASAIDSRDGPRPAAGSSVTTAPSPTGSARSAATAPASSSKSRSVRSGGTAAVSAAGASAIAGSRSVSVSAPLGDAMSRVLRRSSERSITSSPHVLGLLCGAVTLRLVGARLLVAAEQLDEEGAEVHHRLAQVLRARLAGRRAARDVVGGAVVLDHPGVVDGHVGRALVELLRDGVAAVAHHLHHERVGLADGGRRLVDEPPLGVPPALGVAVARGGLELADLELIAALAALVQLGLRFTAVAAALLERAVVLRAEALLQLLGSALARVEQRSDDQGDHDDRQDHDDHGSLPPVAPAAAGVPSAVGLPERRAANRGVLGAVSAWVARRHACPYCLAMWAGGACRRPRRRVLRPACPGRVRARRARSAPDPGKR